MKHCVALVSDFFYPNVGGVENHIYQLAQCLMKRKHKVIVITHAYEDKVGLHYLTNNLKVYYLPLIVIYNQCSLPTLAGSLPLLRWVLLEEQIEIVHGHSSFSTLAHEAMFHAKSLGIHTCFTDHSLFGFADISSILTNKILEISLTDTDSVICVSHTCKENTVLRAKLDPQKVYVIPNAIDPTKFTPPEDTKPYCPNSRISIVVMSRLVYRKGMDLLAGIIPQICTKHCDVDFIVGGDGPKRLLLEETVEHYQLIERVKFLGAVPHENVGNILKKGDIFLNTSLTEAFCIAILEAACCGLQIVSTRVGGVPEVLPEPIVRLSQPSVSCMLEKLNEVIDEIRANRLPPRIDIYRKVAPLYTWQKVCFWAQVAERTEKVYDHVLHCKLPHLNNRMNKLFDCGIIIGKIFVLFVVLDIIFLKILDYYQPLNSRAKKLKKLK